MWLRSCHMAGGWHKPNIGAKGVWKLLRIPALHYLTSPYFQGGQGGIRFRNCDGIGDAVMRIIQERLLRLFKPTPD